MLLNGQYAYKNSWLLGMLAHSIPVPWSRTVGRRKLVARAVLAFKRLASYRATALNNRLDSARVVEWPRIGCCAFHCVIGTNKITKLTVLIAGGVS